MMERTKDKPGFRNVGTSIRPGNNMRSFQKHKRLYFAKCAFLSVAFNYEFLKVILIDTRRPSVLFNISAIQGIVMIPLHRLLRKLRRSW
jgi:hypothetical protein